LEGVSIVRQLMCIGKEPVKIIFPEAASKPQIRFKGPFFLA